MRLDLRALLKDAGLTKPDGEVDLDRAAEALHRSDETIRRWLSGANVDGAALELLQIKARGVATDAVQVPIVADVNAGPLVEQWESPRGHVEFVPRKKPGELVAYTVRGDSMADAGIMDGDVVIVRKQETAESHEIVVALVDNESTLKRLRYRAGEPYLEAAKTGLEPIRPRAGQELRIIGKVLEVRRILEPRT